MDAFDKQALAEEFKYSTARSGGSGGQHVNKVETKVVVKLNIDRSKILTVEQKALLKAKLDHRLSQKSELSMYCQASRSQLKNKVTVTANLLRLIKKSLTIPKKRKPQRISKEAKAKKLENKRKRAQVKKSRQKPSINFD